MGRIRSFKSFKSKEGHGPKGKDLSLFVRYGGLDLKNQNGYTNTDPTYHSPPTRRGFYAFPKSMQELFLVGSIDKFQPGTYPKEPQWNNLSDEEYNKTQKEYDKKTKKIFRSLRREFTKTTGNIWHHLGDFCKTVDIISRHGAWVKTSIQAWEKAFSKSSLTDRYGEDFGGMPDRPNKGRGANTVNTARGVSGMYSKDHYEVFFDEKV